VRRPRAETAARVAVIAVVALLAVAGGYAVTSAVRTRSAPPVPPFPAAYNAAQASPSTPPAPAVAPVPSAAGVRAALTGPLGASALGASVHVEVRDALTGALLYDHASGTPAAPASTAKLLTGAAILAVHRPTDRITTRVVAGAGGALLLVGDGDPTLSGAAAGQPTRYPEAARISDLAAQLRRAHVSASKIVVDDALFTGPTVSPAWAPEDVPSDYASAITPVLTDGGRATPNATIRSAAPDLAAGHELAAALGKANLPVVRGSAGTGRTLATVRSAPIGVLVEQMLEQSDNVLAECLARQVALAEHQPASFTGAATAIRAVLARLGVDPGAGMKDGSGLAASDRVSAAALAGVLDLAAGTAHPQLHVLLAGLPVSAWSGTLDMRYRTGATQAAAGVVRAKTGTLSGVSTLAGVVHDRSGRLLVFALMADAVPSTTAAEPALDAVVARLAQCGCGG